MSNRKGYILAFFLLGLNFGEGVAQPSFEKQIDLGFAANAYSLINTTDGGYLVGGDRYSSNSNDRTNYFPILIKFDADGNVQWAKRLGSSLYGVIFTLSESQDGNFFASGNISGDTIGRSFVLKCDPLGNTIWARTFQNRTSVVPLSPCDDGGCILAGAFSEFAPFVMRIAPDGSFIWRTNFLRKHQGDHFTSIVHLTDGSYVVTGDEGARAVLSLMKIDLSGAILWYKTISNSSDLFNFSSCKTADGGFTFCGTTVLNDDNKNLYIAKFDSAGMLLWGKEIDGFGFDEGLSIAEGYDGDLVVDCFGNPTGIMILHMSGRGVVRSLKTFTGAKFCSSNAIVPSSDGSFVFAGVIGDSLSSAGRLLLVKLDHNINGCHLKDRLFSDHSAGNVLTKTAITSSEGYLDSAFIKLGADLTFKEFDVCDVSEVAVKTTEEERISLSPNPLVSGKSVTIRLNENILPGIYDLLLLDLLGNTLKKEKMDLTGTKQDILFDVSECAAGVYMVELRSEKEPHFIRWMKFVKE